MRKLIVLAVVLTLASVANATVYFELEEIDVLTNSTATFNIISNTTDVYAKYVGAAPGLAEVTDMQPTPNAGLPPIIIPLPYGYEGYWAVNAGTETAPNPGIHWIGTVTAYSTIGTYTIYLSSDFITVEDTLNIYVVPEPMTIGLLAFGSLGLLGKRRR